MRLKLIVLTSFILSNTVIFHANAETKQISDRLDQITISPAFNRKDPRLKELKFLNFTSPLMADVNNQVICINYSRTENNLGMNDELSNVYIKFNQIYEQNKAQGMIYYCDGGEKAVASSSSTSIPLSVVEEQYKIGSGSSTTYNNNSDGNCNYSWQTDSLGRQCGGRSASQRSGGR